MLACFSTYGLIDWRVDSLMSEYPWSEKNNTFTWLSCLYNPFKSMQNTGRCRNPDHVSKIDNISRYVCNLCVCKKHVNMKRKAKIRSKQIKKGKDKKSSIPERFLDYQWIHFLFSLPRVSVLRLICFLGLLALVYHFSTPPQHAYRNRSQTCFPLVLSFLFPCSAEMPSGMLAPE